MENVIDILVEIKNTSSRNEKEAILKANETNKKLKRVLQFAFDPYIVTGLGKKKLQRKVAVIPKWTTLEFEQLMEYVSVNNTGDDYTIAQVQDTLYYIEETEHGLEHIEYYEQILIKDLKIGVTAKTLNKVFGKGFIREHNVMLASRYEFQELGEYALSLKLDGTRCTVIKNFNDIKFFTRNGQIIEGLTELEQEFKELSNGVYDGELLKKNDENLPSKDLFRATQKILRADGEKKNIKFVAFDLLTLTEFEYGKSVSVYSTRLKRLERELLDYCGQPKSNSITIVPIYYIGTDVEMIPLNLELVTKQGFEGLMINKLDGLYECKRSKNLLKVKEFHTVDLKVIGYEEHKHGNKLGSFIVDYKGYEVRVGSGYTDDERKFLWLDRELYIGKIVEVKYFEESQNQNGGLSLRFPTFVTIRWDKEEVSYE